MNLTISHYRAKRDESEDELDASGGDSDEGIDEGAFQPTEFAKIALG